jgi:hypothetical protein
MKKKSTPPTTPGKAFQRADNGYTFRGKKLEPFSFLRQSALIALSLEMGATRVAELAAGLWLMSSPDSVVKKARQEPSAYVDQIDAFADKNGLGSITGKEFQVARDLFDQICADVEANSGKPPADGETDDDESGN